MGFSAPNMEFTVVVGAPEFVAGLAPPEGYPRPPLDGYARFPNKLPAGLAPPPNRLPLDGLASAVGALFAVPNRPPAGLLSCFTSPEGFGANRFIFACLVSPAGFSGGSEILLAKANIPPDDPGPPNRLPPLLPLSCLGC